MGVGSRAPWELAAAMQAQDDRGGAGGHGDGRQRVGLRDFWRTDMGCPGWERRDRDEPRMSSHSWTGPMEGVLAACPYQGRGQSYRGPREGRRRAAPGPLLRQLPDYDVLPSHF